MVAGGSLGSCRVASSRIYTSSTHILLLVLNFLFQSAFDIGSSFATILIHDSVAFAYPPAMASAASSRPGALHSYFQPTATFKRKRSDYDDDVTATDESSSAGEYTVITLPLKKKLAKFSAKPKPARTRAKRSANSIKDAEKLFADTLKAIDKGTAKLDRKVKTISHENRWSITTSDYASNVSDHIDTVDKLAELDTLLAFNLVLSMADASHGDMNATAKMSGESGDDSRPTFGNLDDLLLPLIEKRLAAIADACPKVESLPTVQGRWTREDSDIPTGRDGRPNKQQRGWIYAEKLDFAKTRREERRARRETCEDWISVALADLVEERDYVAAYGVGEDFSWNAAKDAPNEYLPLCIARLKEIDAARSSASDVGAVGAPADL